MIMMAKWYLGTLGPKASWHLSYRWGKTPKKPHLGNLSQPGIKPRPAAWQARMLPLAPQWWTRLVSIHQFEEAIELRYIEINCNFFVFVNKIFSQIINSDSGLLLTCFNNLGSSSNLCLWDQKCAATADLFNSLLFTCLMCSLYLVSKFRQDVQYN